MPAVDKVELNRALIACRFRNVFLSSSGEFLIDWQRPRRILPVDSQQHAHIIFQHHRHKGPHVDIPRCLKQVLIKTLQALLVVVFGYVGKLCVIFTFD